jgi:hypothetical protein
MLRHMKIIPEVKSENSSRAKEHESRLGWSRSLRVPRKKKKERCGKRKVIWNEYENGIKESMLQEDLAMRNLVEQYARLSTSPFV